MYGRGCRRPVDLTYARRLYCVFAEANPAKFNSRLKNQMFYARVSFRSASFIVCQGQFKVINCISVVTRLAS